jgi:hypothetical protein
MCFVRISEQTATFALYNIKRLVFITEVESVYSAVRTESLYKIDTLRLYRVNIRQRALEGNRAVGRRWEISAPHLVPLPTMGHSSVASL